MPTFTYGDPARVTNPGIAGGAVSNAPDYAKLLKMFLVDGGEGVLSAAVVREMKADQINGRPVMYTPMNHQLHPEYGLGFFQSAPFVHPGSSGPEYSDPGLFGTVPWIDVDTGYGAVLVILSNSETGQEMWDAVRPQIIEALN